MGRFISLAILVVVGVFWSGPEPLSHPAGQLIPNREHGSMGYVFKAFLLVLLMCQHGSMYKALPSRKDLLVLKELLEVGKIRPVIDSPYPLCERLTTFRRLEKGSRLRKSGQLDCIGNSDGH